MGDKAQANVRHDFGVSADKLFSVIGDFTNLTWIPAVPKVDFEGEGPGMVRRMYIDVNLPPTVEVLEALDPAERTISYGIPENNPLPVAEYHATMRVVETGTDTCQLDWTCNFETAALSPADSVAAIEGFYGMIIPGIEAAVSA